MPKDEPNPNGQPPDHLHFERSHLTCQRCKRKFEHFTLEEIDDLVQLRCGDVLISKTEMVCLHCGAIFYWNIREKDLAKMATKYGEIVMVMKGYLPE